MEAAELTRFVESFQAIVRSLNFGDANWDARSRLKELDKNCSLRGKST